MGESMDLEPARDKGEDLRKEDVLKDENVKPTIILLKVLG
jgi:hypothetical protein